MKTLRYFSSKSVEICGPHSYNKRKKSLGFYESDVTRFLNVFSSIDVEQIDVTRTWILMASYEILK